MQLPYPLYFLRVTFTDVVDVLLVSWLLYQVYKLLRGSVALNVALGLLSIYLIYLVVNALGLGLLSTILGEFTSVGVLASIILFQQEIRRFLLGVGKVALEGGGPLGWWRRPVRPTGTLPLTAFVEAAKSLAGKETGALICFALTSDLGAYAETGDRLDAEASKRLLLAIFNKTSPLHDGAVLVGPDGRLLAARCILPVSQNPAVPAALGLRHRAALGLTETTDAVVLVVSEETGQMSLVRHGEIYRGLSAPDLRARLQEWLLPGAAKAGG